MIIRRLTAVHLVAPGTIPKTGREIGVPVVLVTVETDEGLTGYGLARGEWHAQAVVAVVTHELAPYLVGESALETERLWSRAFWDLAATYGTKTGVIAQAISGVDQALWDLRGRAFNQPVYRLLGGARHRVPVYVTFGLNVLPNDAMVELAEELVEAGHGALKIQALAADDGLDIEPDVERVRLVRTAVGDGVKLFFDGNGKFRLDIALAMSRRLREYNVTLFEHPVFGRDHRTLAALRRHGEVPISARRDNIWDVRSIVESDSVDVLQVNVHDCGGYSESLKMAHVAEMFRLPVAIGGTFALTNAHLIAGVANGWLTEYHVGIDAAVWGTLFTETPSPEAGWITLGSEPGLGLKLNHDMVRDCEVK